MNILQRFWRLITAADLKEANAQHKAMMERIHRQQEMAPYYSWLLTNLDQNHEWPDELKELYPKLAEEHEFRMQQRQP